MISRPSQKEERRNNPNGVKFEPDINKVGKHFYVMPPYKTELLVCTTCLRPQDSEVHRQVQLFTKSI
jgi:hypothetical protein